MAREVNINRPVTSKAKLLPIKQRPKSPRLPSIVFNLFFAAALITLHAVQLLVVPLMYFPATCPIFEAINMHLKRCFAVVLLLNSHLFAPTKLRITSEGEVLTMDKLITRDATGKVVKINLPLRAVVMANHQVYCDWVYLWNFLYFADVHDGIIILLKASLKWVPIVGPAMQLFQFIFLARSWLHDQITLGHSIIKLADDAQRSQRAFQLLIFPEGTLVSPNTRPISKKFADKMGIDDMKHCLLPRSTGLLFCLRALAQKIPDMDLIDITCAYDGIPPDGYGQDYFTLQSIYGHGQAPSTIHLHLRSYPVSSLPLGAVDTSPSLSDAKSLKVGTAVTEAADADAKEKQIFDDWLRQRWIEKDEMLGRFYATGTLNGEAEAVEIDVAPREPKEWIQVGLTMAFGGWVVYMGCRIIYGVASWVF